MKFYFSKNENGEQIEEELVVVQETLDVPTIYTQQHWKILRKRLPKLAFPAS